MMSQFVTRCMSSVWPDIVFKLSPYGLVLIHDEPLTRRGRTLSVLCVLYRLFIKLISRMFLDIKFYPKLFFHPLLFADGNKAKGMVRNNLFEGQSSNVHEFSVRAFVTHYNSHVRLATLFSYPS